jgi:hypothetical protein
MREADRGCEAEVLGPAEFAEQVRQIAVDVHKALKSPAADERVLVELVERIDELHQQRADWPGRQVDRWLQNAARRIRALKRGPCAVQGDR